MKTKIKPYSFLKEGKLYQYQYQEFFTKFIWEDPVCSTREPTELPPKGVFLVTKVKNTISRKSDINPHRKQIGTFQILYKDTVGYIYQYDNELYMEL
jgi:hypothetical protein